MYFFKVGRRFFEQLKAAEMFSDIAASGCLISCAIAAVAASTLISRFSRSRRNSAIVSETRIKNRTFDEQYK